MATNIGIRLPNPPETEWIANRRPEPLQET
jgi:hypothetical protein